MSEINVRALGALIVIEETGHYVPMQELGEFLQALDYAYSRIRVLGSIRDFPVQESDIGSMTEDWWDAVLVAEWEKFLRDDDEDDGWGRVWGSTYAGISITRVAMDSPIEIVPVAALYALVVATVFSGGTVKLGNLEFRLPPLGKGIEALRKALRPGPERPLLPPRARDVINK